jgi:Ca2+-binding EF-hand superfamily protein
MPTSELEKESRQNEIMYGPGFTLNLLAEMYRDLVEHQKEQTQHFDSAISRLLEEKRLADEKQEQLRKEAEQARQDEERKKMDALEATVRIGGKAGAMAKFEIQRLKQAALTEPEENGKAKANDAAGVAYRQYEKAWPGGTLTVPKLESVFKDLPSRPSGSQARYFFENRSRYCDESMGQDYLTTDGFAKLVQDLGFLQKKMAEEKQEALKKIFTMLDAKRKGEISLLDILKQIDSQDKELLMPMVDVLMHQCDVNKNGLLDLAEFHAFYTSWVEMHRIFEIFDDCRLEETWSDDREGHLEFADVELLSSVFLSIRSKTLQGRHQVAPLEAVITSLGERWLLIVVYDPKASFYC